MSEFIFVDIRTSFMEVIHIKLSDKGGKVTMFKISAENSLREFYDILHYECTAFIIPADDIFVFTSLFSED